MQTTFTSSYEAITQDEIDENGGAVINLAAHRSSKSDRFPDVEDLLDRLTDDTVSVANGDHRTRR